MPASPPARADISTICGSMAWLHAVVLRSPHAHARIDRIDADGARAMPGVLAVLTGEDVACRWVAADAAHLEANVQTGERFAFAPQPLLATGKVRHVGEPVALIVAETRAQALDAAERVVVDYDRIAGGHHARMRRGAGRAADL